MPKIWNIKKYDEAQIDKLIKEYNISKTLAKLIVSIVISQ